MNKLIAAVLLCLTTQVFAIELAGVRLDERIKVADASLLLNGAGVRAKLIFKIYVAGLYLDMKINRAEEILKNAGPKRVLLVMKRDLDSQEMLAAFNKGMADNNSPSMLQALETSIRDFSTIFDVINKVREGDVITIDYIPAYGTHISVNGVEQGQVGGGLAFYRAMLGIWLGEHPVDDSLKEELLGN